MRQTVPRGSLLALVESRRRATVTSGVIMGTLVLAAVLDIVLSGDEQPTHKHEVVFTIIYGLLASLLATAIVSRVVTVLQERQQQNRVKEELGLLGITPDAEATIAIVVPAFPISCDPRGSDSVGIREPVLDSIADDDLESKQAVGNALDRVGDLLLKRLEEIVNFAYAHRDMFLVADLFKLIGQVGLPTPMLVSDIDFISSVSALKPADRRLFIREARVPDSSPVPVDTVVVVGLWSNLLTDRKSVV